MIESTPAVAIESAALWGPALRMILSLAGVLAILGGCAWLARRLREGGRLGTGVIEIVSGISLGGREKVVLLRVGGEEILVGISPTGMRPLHVLKGDGKAFAEFMEQPK